MIRGLSHCSLYCAKNNLKASDSRVMVPTIPIPIIGIDNA
ncbi:MAG: hypothetical protein Hyperionvirus2_77 [Hyperionvirus sp.]|uniref:Uncharacterized protein n=1 Tax=Hyperionvirus sp. TaxID=2487770 RepID=A0A3G5ABN7_9VIRU|nr:MAG: hypothetical protein Hyperionvirus2_77 [Hyperionvirus sp.]